MTAPQPAVTAYVGLGANLGDAIQTIQAAILALAALPSTAIGARSSLYRTKPIDADGDHYINAVAELHTELDPETLLNELQQIELRFGRVRSYPNAPRTLDCDLLLYGQQSIHSTDLTVPHPRMHQRAFVLIPLLEIAPEITIPFIGPANALQLSVSDQAIQKIV